MLACADTMSCVGVVSACADTIRGLYPTCEDICELIIVRVAPWMKYHSIGQGPQYMSLCLF